MSGIKNHCLVYVWPLSGRNVNFQVVITPEILILVTFQKLFLNWNLILGKSDEKSEDFLENGGWKGNFNKM